MMGHDDECECIFCKEFPEEDETLFAIENNFPNEKDFNNKDGV